MNNNIVSLAIPESNPPGEPCAKQSSNDDATRVHPVQPECEENKEVFKVIEPWPEEVEISALLDDIESIVRRYTVLDDVYVIAVTLWAVFTWVHTEATVSPILNLTSPEKRCGKSTLLGVTELLSCRPISSGNISTAALYRSIEEWQPT